MKPASTNGGLATSIYRLFLRLYPRAFRDRHEAEMMEIFEQEWRQAQADGGARCARLGVRLAWDLVRTVPRERASTIFQPSAATAPALLILGAFTASFLLPVYGKDAGWRCVLFVTYVGLHPGSPLGFAVAWLSLAANLGVPLVLALLATPRLNFRLPRFTPWLTLLFVANASYFFWDFALQGGSSISLSTGYYVWWTCQIATTALAFWKRRPAPLSGFAAWE